MDFQLTQTEETNAPRNLTWISFLRIAGSFLVVLAHVNGWGSGSEWAEKFYYTLSRNGVPLFFMMSGFLLLAKQEDMWVFFKKRAAKIVIPFLVWSIVYDLYSDHSFLSAGITLEGIIKLFIRILRGPRAAHLWFFYALIGLYLFTPILRLFIAKARQIDLFYYIGLWVLVVPVLAIVEVFTPIRIGFEMQYATGYVGLFLIGLVIGNLNTSPRQRWLALAVFVIGFAITFLVFYYNLPPRDNELAFRSYQSLNILMMAIPAFLLLKALGETIPARYANVLEPLSQASFGIYLIHLILQDWLTPIWQGWGLPMGGPSVLVIPVVATVFYLLSFAATYVIRKIPILRATVP